MNSLKHQYLTLFSILLLVIPGLLNAQSKKVNAVKVSESPLIDGLLNDEAWNKGISITDFLQQEPVPGNTPSFKTEFKIIYDDNNLYIGVMCYDDEPEKIIAREMKWDGFISADDNIKIIFDTFNDDRSAYWFGTNPLGAQNDALLTGFEMSGFNEDWHGIWEVECAILENGWSAEFRFPFSTFKFHDKQIQTWGFNILRVIRRKNEDLLWTSIGKNLGFLKMAEAGDLTGLENIKRGNPVYLMPYISLGSQFVNGSKKYLAEPGLDVKYGITETLSLDATFNTDFAQVESDRARINLTRFPLFFPEKREFFLEGRKTFDFSLGGNNNLFYSRRIGISRNQEIPIIGGVKLVGRVGDFELGFINMQTAEKGSEPTTNYGTFRTKYDLLNSSYAGFMITNKLSGESNTSSFGGDIHFSFNDFLGDKNLIVHASAAKSDLQNSGKNSWAGNFYIDYPNDLIDSYLGYRFIQSNFDPEIGFISRRGFQQLVYNLDISPRINRGGIKKLQFEAIESSMIFSGNGILQSAAFAVSPIGIEFDSGDEIGIGVHRVFDRPDRDFEIFDNTTINAGSYWYTTYGIGFDSSPMRNIYGEANFITGGYYSGNRSELEGRVTFTVNKNLTVGGDFTYNYITINNNTLKTSEIGGRIAYTFSKRVNSSLFAQWNNEQNELNMNYRFNWKPKIGSDFYVVINQLISTENKIHSKDIIILAKFVWMMVI
ncbi:MAG: DUF5916 domain-containing protein [Bacteroidota bacterium]